MNHGIFSLLRRTKPTLIAAALAVTVSSASLAADPPVELRVLTHSSFAIPKPLLAQFEKDAGVKLRIVKAGDAGEMLNKLILTRAAPIADVVFGIDNALASKALAADVLESTSASASQRKSAAPLPAPLVPVDYPFHIPNFWFHCLFAELSEAPKQDDTRVYCERLVVRIRYHDPSWRNQSHN